MYITTRTRYVENANEHVRKTKCNFRKTHHCTTNDMVASAEKKFARMAHTPFLSKRFLKSTGESFGSDTLSDWCMQRDFGRLDWLHASNPDQSFPLLVSRLPLACSSYDIPHCDNRAGRTMEGFGTPRSHGVLSTSREASSAGLLTPGTLANQGRMPVSFSSFTNLATMTCDNSVDPSARIKALFAASLPK